MQYKILRVVEKHPTDALNRLEEKVAAALADGWMPIGGASLVLTAGAQYIACQSATKAEPN